MESWHAVSNMGRGRIAWWNGRPAAIYAYTELWPSHWEVWMYGTDDFANVAIELLRWGRKEANNILAVCKGARLQCDVREGHPDAHKLIRTVGGRPEGELMRYYGKDGSSYQRYVWLNGVDDAYLKPNLEKVA